MYTAAKVSLFPLALGCQTTDFFYVKKRCIFHAMYRYEIFHFFFTLFTNNSLFYPWLKKGMHVVVMEARLAFCPFGCCETCCFPFMTKKDAATIVKCFQIHQHPCCMCIDPSYHHAHCLWLLFFASEEIWPTYYLMTQTERNINPFSPNIHIQILQTDLYTFP